MMNQRSMEMKNVDMTITLPHLSYDIFVNFELLSNDDVP